MLLFYSKILFNIKHLLAHDESYLTLIQVNTSHLSNCHRYVIPIILFCLQLNGFKYYTLVFLFERMVMQ